MKKINSLNEQHFTTFHAIDERISQQLQSDLTKNIYNKNYINLKFETQNQISMLHQDFVINS